MLRFFRTKHSNCETRSRREFLLEAGSLPPLGLTLPMLLGSQVGGQEPNAPARNCILIWTTWRHESS